MVVGCKNVPLLKCLANFTIITVNFANHGTESYRRDMFSGIRQGDENEKMPLRLHNLTIYVFLGLRRENCITMKVDMQFLR